MQSAMTTDTGAIGEVIELNRPTMLDVHCLANLEGRPVLYLWPKRVPKQGVRHRRTDVSGSDRTGSRCQWPSVELDSLRVIT